MGTVHHLLDARGRASPSKPASNAPSWRRLHNTLLMRIMRSALLTAAGRNARFLTSGLLTTRLWGISAERIKLMVEPGRRPVGDGTNSEFVGVPFGSHARLILLYLQTEALRTGKREVELGRSLREWLGRIGVSVGGMTGRSVRDQAERISRCRLTFHLNAGGKASGLVNQSIVDRALFIEESDGRQGRLTLETAKLSEGFFDQLKKHPVPLEEAAIKALYESCFLLSTVTCGYPTAYMP